MDDLKWALESNPQHIPKLYEERQNSSSPHTLSFPFRYSGFTVGLPVKLSSHQQGSCNYICGPGSPMVTPSCLLRSPSSIAVPQFEHCLSTQTVYFRRVKKYRVCQLHSKETVGSLVIMKCYNFVSQL